MAQRDIATVSGRQSTLTPGETDEIALICDCPVVAFGGCAIGSTVRACLHVRVCVCVCVYVCVCVCEVCVCV